MGSEEFVKWLTSLGVGGVIAGLLFMFYRKDVKFYTELWRGQSEMLVTVIKENSATIAKNSAAVERNTAIAESLHSRLDRVIGTDRDGK